LQEYDTQTDRQSWEKCHTEGRMQEDISGKEDGENEFGMTGIG
jgi:hypothetical protein